MGWSAMADRVLSQTLRTFRQDLGAIYRRPGFADSVLANVIFDDTYFAQDTQTGVDVSSKRPIMGVRTADLPDGRSTAKDRIIITRTGVTKIYKITDVQPDGEAGTSLFLMEAPEV